MLNLVIPDNNIPEREYILRSLFFDFLGLQYNVTVNDAEINYSINFDKSELVIKDYFFVLYPDTHSYLTTDSLPGKKYIQKMNLQLKLIFR